MKLFELLKGINIISTNADMDMEINGISYDSRLCSAGDLFVAIKGFESDGHRFISKAYENGAIAVLCEDITNNCIPYIQVEDCRYAMSIASINFYGNPASQMTMIGFTGTSGKTSSSYIMKDMLESALGAKVGLIGTIANYIGDTKLVSDHTTPESLELQKLLRRMADEGCTHVVMEASSHALTLKRVAGVVFDVAVYLNLSHEHLDFHGTMDEYAAAKKLIFSQCRRGCIYADDEYADYMALGENVEIIKYGVANSSADLQAKDIRISEKNISFTANYKGNTSIIRLAMPGIFSVNNALAVAAAGLSLGMSLEECAKGIDSAKGVKGRMESVPTDGDYSIVIDYAHKPDAFEKVLKTLKQVTRGKLTVLFGCGGDRDKQKRPMMGKIAVENADFVIITDDNPRTENSLSIIKEICEGIDEKHKEYKVIQNRVEAISWAIDKAGVGDVILLAGKGHEDYQICGHEKHRMDEREIVANILEKRRLGQ